MTGREESVMKAKAKMAEMLNGQGEEVRGFYSDMIHSGKTKSFMTQKSYLQIVIAFMAWIDKPVSEIIYDDVLRYMDEKSNNGKTSGSWMVAVYSGLKKYFAYLRKTKRIKENPMDEMDRPAAKPSDQVKRTYLTQDEIDLVISEIRRSGGRYAKRDELIFALFLTNAMRLNALYELNISDIDFEKKEMRVIEKENKFRVFYPSDNVLKLAASYIKERKSIAPHVKTDAMFITEDGNRMTRYMIESMITRRCNVTGKHITPHKIRASTATLLSIKGYSVYDIQQFLGHASPHTTEIYLQDKNEASAKANKGANSFYS